MSCEIVIRSYNTILTALTHLSAVQSILAFYPKVFANLWSVLRYPKI